jgi:hypothetical protein
MKSGIDATEDAFKAGTDLTMIGGPTKKRKYVLQFHGRKIGAIGFTYPIQKVVEALSEDSAKSMAYDRHDHVYGLRCRLFPDSEVNGE